MEIDQHPAEWREKALQVGSMLHRAHSLIGDLAAALDEGDDASARLTAQGAHKAVNSVTRAIHAMRSELPPEPPMAGPEAVGSTLAIGGSGVATIALDVMVNAMMALAATDDEGDTDFLIGTCVDAESAYEVAAAVVQAAPRRHGPAVMDLRRAFDTEGEIALRDRLIRARPRVREIYERVRSAA
jgi:hypothetical protein